MKNYEKYMEEIVDSLSVNSVSCNFINRRVFHEETCTGRNCMTCNDRFKEWLKEEYNPQIDWSKVPVDTPIILHGSLKRYFNKAEQDYIVYFDYGRTSWSNDDKQLLNVKKQDVQLAREEDIEKYSI